MIGKTLAHYEILAKIGQGGMGEVYRAFDSKLDREVALKVLPADMASDPERLGRFEREAKVVAALKHPNIVTIYSVEEIDGVHFLTMELVEGKALSHILPKEGLPLDRFFDIAIPLADAVSSAHARGITHRDLKPDNIMIDNEGRLRVLDFGLAKLQDPSDPGNTTLAMTVDAVTEEGKILGTVAYMSPEQAEGKPVDSRSDIFSLGTILYEMTTGARPFQGDTGISTIGSILKDEPATVTELNHALPRHLGRIIRRCLAKKPERRYQSAGDLRNDLEGLKEELDSGELPPPGSTAAAGSRWLKGRSLAAILAVVAVSATGLTFGLSRLLPRGVDSPDSEILRPQMEMTQLTHTGDSGYSAAISPDGKYVVHLQGGDEGQSLWLLQVSTGRRVQVVGASGTIGTPTFSPDGDLIYFPKDEKDADYASLYKVPLLGGSPTRVLENAFGKISFSPDGNRFVFKRDGEGGKELLMTASIDGSDVREISSRVAPDNYHGYPAWSPDGRVVVVPANRIGIGDYHLVEVPSAGGDERRIPSGPWDHIERVEWLPDGSGLILQAIKEKRGNFNIWEVPYPEGPPRKITTDLNSYSGISLTADGATLVTQVMAGEDALWVTYPGQEIEPVRMTAGGQNYDVTGVSWTPDGRIVYGATSMEGVDLWISEVGTEKPTQITFGGTSRSPSVSPDGKFIIFVSSSAPEHHIWRIDLDGKNPVQLTFGEREIRPRCHPDGKTVYFLGDSPGGYLIYRVPIEGGKPDQVSDRVVSSRTPAISPAGDQLVAWIYDENLDRWQAEILLLDGEQDWSVIGRVGSNFQWAPDGKAIIYSENDNYIQTIWSLPLNGNPPRELTTLPANFAFDLEWAPDGKALALNLRDVDWDVVILKNFH